MAPLLVATVLVLLVVCAYLGSRWAAALNADRELALDQLQGYWRIDADVYLLIDGALVQIVDLGEGSPAELFKSTQSKITYRARELDARVFDARVAGRGDVKLPKRMTIRLYPIAGSVIVDADGAELFRAIRDNELSLAHFAAP